MAVKRDRLKTLGAMLMVPLLGAGTGQALAGTEDYNGDKKKKKKKVTKKKRNKKEVIAAPEPGAAVLLGTGLIAAAVANKLGRRKKKAK